MESAHDAQINAAIAHLNRQMKLNYTAAARAFKVDCTTLALHYKGKIVSRAEATSIFHQRLNNTQKDTLLSYIDALTDRHISSTSQLIRNLAEEILQRLVEKN